MSPIVNEARKQYRGKVNYVDANLDQPSAKELAKEHGMIGYPILLFLDSEGNRFNVLRGVLPLSVVEQAFEDVIANE
jgi:thiol:disulfide interchange protein